MEKKKERRKYPVDFKQDALRMSEKIGISEASDKLGVPLSTLNKWRSKKHQLPVEKSTDILRLQIEVKSLKKKLIEKEALIEMLKKVTAFFSRESEK